MVNKNLGPQIIALREQNKTYDEIATELECSKGTIAYWVGEGQKAKWQNRYDKTQATASGVLKRKIARFKTETSFEINTELKRETSSARKATRIISDKLGEFAKIKQENNKLSNRNVKDREFNFQDIIDKFGEETVCYLTGDSIKLNEPHTYQLDHIIPRSRGGTNSIDNLGITSTTVNLAKRNMTPEEFVELCRKVVAYWDVTHPADT